MEYASFRNCCPPVLYRYSAVDSRNFYSVSMHNLRFRCSAAWIRFKMDCAGESDNLGKKVDRDAKVRYLPKVCKYS